MKIYPEKFEIYKVVPLAKNHAYTTDSDDDYVKNKIIMHMKKVNKIYQENSAKRGDFVGF